jgi:hypothetical protein
MVLILMLLMPAIVYAAPSLKFETDTHDFGKVKEGDKLEYAFEFANTGADDLHIERIHAS